MVVVSAAAFALLSLIDGVPQAYKQAIVLAVGNWVVMSAVAILLWRVWRGSFGHVPGLMRVTAGFLALFYALVSGLGILGWAPLWMLFKLVGLSQAKTQPLALFGVFALWFFACAFFVLRGFLRWLSKRYEHHGVAVGLGPLYFYFKRRKAS
jgi:hypothetical protein